MVALRRPRARPDSSVMGKGERPRPVCRRNLKHRGRTPTGAPAQICM